VGTRIAMIGMCDASINQQLNQQPNQSINNSINQQPNQSTTQSINNPIMVA
jgi:hypothetical protein